MFLTQRRILPTLMGLLVLACRDEKSPAGPEVATRTWSEPADQTGSPLGAPPLTPPVPLNAQGSYRFFIPADFNGGIFGVDIDNAVVFSAHRTGNGDIRGHFHYTQTALGQDFIFSGTVTCFQVYDTPVLQRFPGIPAMVGNRAKWGGVILESNDPTIPAGGFIWFQSIDNGAFPDLSTLSGFGNEAANEAFCASANVPNPNFGPHAVNQGNIVVQ
jgi:hypothetical protein